MYYTSLLSVVLDRFGLEGLNDHITIVFTLDFLHSLLFSSLQIEDGEIYASINQKDGMVCFHDNPEKYNNPAMLHKIDQEVWRLRSVFTVLVLCKDCLQLQYTNPAWIFENEHVSFFPLFSDVEMYTAGWETKVYGSGNHSKPTICAEGEGGLQQHWSCFFLFWLMCVLLVEWARLKMFSCRRVCCPKSSNFKHFIEAEDKMLKGLETVWSLFVAHVACLSRLCCQVTWCLQSRFHEIHCWAFDKHWLCNSPFSV